VSAVQELQQIKTTAATLAVKDGIELTYDQYCTLLESAAIDYDQANKKSSPEISANIHDFSPESEEEVVFEEPMFDVPKELFGGIDLTAAQQL
ncbi:hypothetical protein P6O80_15585, partial [Clostridium perfringens]|nr:hypothetical protein [Clostridium perfringens]